MVSEPDANVRNSPGKTAYEPGNCPAANLRKKPPLILDAVMKHRSLFLLGALVILLYSTAGQAAATPTDSLSNPADSFNLTTAFADLETGKLVLVRTVFGLEYEGRWQGSDSETVYLAVPDREEWQAIPSADVEVIWVRGRATATGAKTLGIGGALIGFVYGLLLAAYLTDTDPDGSDVLPVIGLTSLTTVAGAAGGAAVGGLVGTALPRWHLVYSRQPDLSGASIRPGSAPPAYPRKAPRLTMVNLSLGYTRGTEDRAQAGLGGRATLLTELNRHVAVGPELGYAFNGYRRVSHTSDRVITTTVPNTFHAGAALQWTLFRSVLSPYVTGGLGLYIRHESYLGYSLGGGLQFSGGRTGPNLSLDLRYHDSVSPQNSGFDDPDGRWPAFMTVGISVTF